MYEVYNLLHMIHNKGFPGGSVVKNPSAMQGMPVHSLGQEDPLEEGMATHSRTLAWGIPGTEEPGGLQSMGPQRVRLYLSDRACTHTYCVICCCCCSLFSPSVVSDSSRPHKLQYARLPCPSLSPGVCSNSCPLNM